jgi:SAM-dependent methyltransferase
MNWARRIYYALPPIWRRRARRVLFAPHDLLTLLRGRPSYNGIPLPLRGAIFTGGGSFLEEGLRFREFFIELGGLKPTESVLDIGSGLGRMAIPLTDYLHETSDYKGFDVVEDAVDSCRRNISSRYANFEFGYVPLNNDLYTISGQAADQFVFPYQDQQFSFAFATSVFTHMVRDEVANYLAETCRVTEPGGRFLATFFIMDSEAEACSPQSDYKFAHRKGPVWLMDKNVRGANVAFHPELIEEMGREAGWQRSEFFWGNWSGRRGTTYGGQDMVVFHK